MYTYRIRVANLERVQIEQLDLNNQSLGNPSGQLRFEQRKEEINSLIENIREREFSDPNLVRLLGEALFEVIFDDVLRQSFINFYDRIVYQNAQKIRIELDIDEQLNPEIAALPWEFMRLPQRANLGTLWLSTAPDLVLSRRRSQWRLAHPIQLKQNETLRIALVIATPQNLGSIAYNKVKNSLERLANEQSRRIELLPIVDLANPESIDSILRHKPHIFHLIAHGRLQDENDRDIGQLALVDELGDAMWVDADYFSSLFARYCPGIVLLQACEGGAFSESEAFVGLASRVVQQNIPVVVAMQYEVSNSTASKFSCHFYQELVEGKPVDVAVQEGRYAIALGSKQYRTRDFATPIIFMRVSDGNLFQWEREASRGKNPDIINKPPIKTNDNLRNITFAGFLPRLLANCIDRIILIPGSLLLDFIQRGPVNHNNPDEFYGRFLAMYIILGFMYCTIMESSSMQGTVGKFFLKTKVVDARGNKISFNKAAQRNFGKWISYILLCLGFVMIEINTKKQSLHDLLSNCFVREI